METKLSAAPLALGVLGAVAVVGATGRDFSLNTRDENGRQLSEYEYKRLNHPESFRACLAQVGNEVHSALLTAHGNMGFIDVTMMQIPGQMMGIVSLLRRGTSQEIQDQLPLELSQMHDASEKGKANVKEVLKEFDVVIATLKELVEGTQSARGITEEASRNTEVQIRLAEQEEEHYSKELQRVEDELEQVKRKIEQEEREFKAELDKAGSWEEIGKQVASSVTDTGLNVVVPAFAASGGMALMASTFSNMESMAAAGVLGLSQAGKIGTMLAGGKGGDKGDIPAPKPQKPVTQDERDVAKYVEELCTASIHPLMHYFSDRDRTLNMLALKDDKKLKQAKKGLQNWRKKIEKKLQPGKVSMLTKTDVQDLLNDLQEFLDQLTQARGQEALDVADTELYEQLEDLSNRGDELGIIQTATYCEQIAQQPSPSLVDKAKNAIASSTISDTMAKRLFTTMELRKEQLRATEERAEELRKRKLDQNKELHKVLKEMASFNEEHMTQQEVLATITKGLTALYQLRKQWTQLFLYFKEIDNLVQAAMGPAMTKFIKMAELEGKQQLEYSASSENRPAMTELTKDRLFKSVSQVVVTSRVVLFLSSSYLSLSNQHLMPMINSFGELLALKSDDTSVNTKQASLMSQAMGAQRAIHQIIEKGHEDFKRDLHKRQDAIEAAYNEQECLQHVPDEVRREVKERVAKSFKQAEKRAHDPDEDFCA